jgi:hypothetical protein
MATRSAKAAETQTALRPVHASANVQRAVPATTRNGGTGREPLPLGA